MGERGGDELGDGSAGSAELPQLSGSLRLSLRAEVRHGASVAGGENMSDVNQGRVLFPPTSRALDTRGVGQADQLCDVGLSSSARHSRMTLTEALSCGEVGFSKVWGGMLRPVSTSSTNDHSSATSP